MDRLLILCARGKPGGLKDLRKLDCRDRMVVELPTREPLTGKINKNA